MFRTMRKSKIHRATVTQTDLHYVGPVTVDRDLTEAADLMEGEQVAIVVAANRIVELGSDPGHSPQGSGRRSGAVHAGDGLDGDGLAMAGLADSALLRV